MMTDTMENHDQASLDRMKAIWALVTKYDRGQAKKKVMELLRCTEMSARNAIREANNYFADVEGANMAAEKLKMVLRYEAIIMDDRNPIEIRLQYEKLLIDVLGVKKEGREEKPSLPNVSITGDPAALTENE